MSWEFQVSSESLTEVRSNRYSRFVLLFTFILVALAVGGFFGA